MKTTFFIICFTAFSLGAFSQKPTKIHETPENTLEISSLLTAKGKIVNNYTITLLCDGVEIWKKEIKKSRPVYINLEPNKVFSLLYSKPGYADKIVIVNTELPDIRLSRNMFFEYDIELDPAHSTQKGEFHDYPVALIRYNTKANEFSYSQSYFSEVHNYTETASK